ncbi:hypothetical protein ACJD0Z_18045 [Flavobacteriaceae bacterium M23B6Z8]
MIYSKSSHIYALVLCNFVLLISFAKGYAQDPSCEYIVTFEDVQMEMYTYEIIIADINYEDPKDSLITPSQIRKYGSILKNNVLRSDDDSQILVGYKKGYCYPDNSNQDQLKILITRIHKTTKVKEQMYAFCPLHPGSYAISIRSFRSGKREVSVFRYEGPYDIEKPVSDDYRERKVLKKMRVLLN